MADDAPLADAQKAAVIRWADSLSDIYSKPFIPVHEVAEAQGVDVQFEDFGKYSNSVAGYCDFQEKALVVNAEDPFDRQLFTIAHELGHWMLHRDAFRDHPEKYAVLMRIQNPSSENQFELEANLFAEHLLVPSRLLKPVMLAPVSSLAAVFRVNRTLIEKRLRDVK